MCRELNQYSQQGNWDVQLHESIFEEGSDATFAKYSCVP